MPMPACHRYTVDGVLVHQGEVVLEEDFLSVAGLSLIYRGHNWAAGRTGGARAPSLSQPQVMANYIFI